jgi:hypothetical protein
MKITLTVLLLTATALWGQENVTCTNATLQGDYGFTVTGTRPSAPGATTIETVVGVAMTSFDGDGNLTQTDNIHGSISGYTTPDRPGTGTYSLNADCTGTMQLSSPGSPTLTLRIVVVDSGNEVRTAVVAPAPVMVTSDGRRTTPRSGGGFFMFPDIRTNAPAQ